MIEPDLREGQKTYGQIQDVLIQSAAVGGLKRAYWLQQNEWYIIRNHRSTLFATLTGIFISLTFQIIISGDETIYIEFFQTWNFQYFRLVHLMHLSVFLLLIGILVSSPEKIPFRSDYSKVKKNIDGHFNV